MPRYEPIDPVVVFQASLSDLLAFQWKPGGVCADFALPDDEGHRLRVEFHSQCIVRILDEMPLSTEADEGPAEGLVPEHFAYRVYGAAFLRAQSEAWRLAFNADQHYLFITGWGCLDVVSGSRPRFSVIPYEAATD